MDQPDTTPQSEPTSEAAPAPRLPEAPGENRSLYSTLFADRYLTLASQAHIIAEGKSRYRIEHVLTGRTVSLSWPELQMVTRFSDPLEPESVIESSDLPEERARQIVEQLKDYQLLVRAHHPMAVLNQLTNVPSPTFFKVPFVDPTVERVHADFCLYGVPYEAGHTGMPDAAHGPTVLREYSTYMPSTLDNRTGRPSGWYDFDTGRAHLADAQIVDAGDVLTFPGEPPGRCFDRLTELVTAILDSGAIPVGIGGDHSMTAPILRGFGGKELTIVQFDAHSDLDTYAPAGILHHGNVMSKALGFPGVQEVVALGLRGMGPTPSNLEEWSSPRIGASELRRRGVPALRELIEHIDGPVYVTVDLDVLDPAYLPSVGTPLPGGLEPTQLKELLWEVGTTKNVIGFDFVELSPHSPTASHLAIAAELLVTLAGAVHHKRTQ